jgi:hypothetical protein
MFAANAYVIRQATSADASVVQHLSVLDSARDLSGEEILIGEIAGEPVAAFSISSGRVVADPFKKTARLVAHMRLRASAMTAAQRTPSLRERMLAGIRVSPRSPVRHFATATP